MALISLRQLLDHAAEHDYGVPAFNVNNLEQTRAIMEAADATNSPVIMQASAGARKYAGAPFLRAMMEAAMNEFPHIPVVVHQDHGVSAGVCQRSIQLGFSSVMMDGSLGEDGKTPMDFDYNVAITRQAVEMAHSCGVSVEGELGCLGSLETGEAGEEDGIGAEGKLTLDQMLTDPEEAAQFVKATDVDALAIACGTSHGAYKFTRPPTGLRKYTRAFPIHIWSCTAPLQCPRIGWRSSTSLVVKYPRLTVCRWNRFRKAFVTAYAKSILIPTCALLQQARFVVFWRRTRLSLIRANIWHTLLRR